MLARNAFKMNLVKMITLIHTICNLANTGRQMDKQKTVLLESAHNAKTPNFN